MSGPMIGLLHKRFFAALLAGSVGVGLTSTPAAAGALRVDGAAMLDVSNQLLLAERGGHGVSRSEAARRAQSEHGGKILSVDPDDDGYRVKLLEDGTVRTVRVPGGGRGHEGGDNSGGGFFEERSPHSNSGESDNGNRGRGNGRRGRRGD